jgi:hypothetical protein
MFLLIAHFGSLDFAPGLRQHRRASGVAPAASSPPSPAARPRRHRQVRPDPPLHLAARRDGRPHARLRAHPRGDHGHRRHLHGRPLPRPLRPAPHRPHRRRHASARHRDLRRHHRHGAARHQARPRLLHRLAARLHVPGLRSRRLLRRHLPPHDPRLLQGAALPRRRLRHPRLSGEQDMRKMGGLRKRIPITFWTMSAGVFAIAGIPPFAGFFSKDEILYQTFISPNPLGKLLWFVGLLTAGLTSFYMFRLWFKTFFGEPRFEHGPTPRSRPPRRAPRRRPRQQVLHPHEADPERPLPRPRRPRIPLDHDPPARPPRHPLHHRRLGRRPRSPRRPQRVRALPRPVFAAAAPEVATSTSPRPRARTLAAVSLLTAALGFFVAYLFYYRKPGTAAALAAKSPVYSLLDHKYWVDEIYGRLHRHAAAMFSRLILSGLVDAASSGHHRRPSPPPRPRLARPPHPVRKHSLLRRLARRRRRRRHRHRPLRPRMPQHLSSLSEAEDLLLSFPKGTFRNHGTP